MPTALGVGLRYEFLEKNNSTSVDFLPEIQNIFPLKYH